MAALFNTAGRDTAERLTRLEAALAGNREHSDATIAVRPAAPKLPLAGGESSGTERARFDAVLTALSEPRASTKSDAMPANPADDVPLIDPGFKESGPVRAALDAKVGQRPKPISADEPAAPLRPAFDPATAERPPQPQSSFAKAAPDPFQAAPTTAAAATEAPAPSPNGTSTFVAAARRAQRARQEAAQSVPAGANSPIGRALARFLPGQAAASAAAEAVAEAPSKVGKSKDKASARAEAPDVAPVFGPDAEAPAARESFLTRHRRPLLLAATLIAVSMLALNLVIQRMEPQVASPEAAVDAPSLDPVTDEVSLTRPEPRVIDMLDNTTTASINPSEAMSFTKPVAATAMPATLQALPVSNPATGAPAEVAPEVTGSIPLADAATPETFEMPPEAIGPLALRQAAADGDPRSQFEVAAIYAEGRAVDQDHAEAAKWYERAAAQGFAPAQYRLGNLYEAGQGLDKDIEVAKLWYQRAAEAGNRMAMHNLAALYAGGVLGDQEFETAAEWFAQAAARGMTDSQFNLGMLYARGLGVEQDFEQSYRWFSLAARNGDSDAGQARDDIAKSLSAEAVRRLTDEIAAWKAEPLDLAANFAPIGTWSSDFDPGAAIAAKDVVSKVQHALAKLGFDIGAPDGLAGPKTAEAIKAFEQATGMSQSGVVNPRLLAVLGSQPV